jgi:hypothetical protein
LLGALLALVPSIPAFAGSEDFRLNARGRNGQLLLINQNSDGSFSPNEGAWKNLVDELSYVFAPRIASPAETLGYAGFSVGAMWSGTFVSSGQDYWHVTEIAQQTGNPDGLLHTLQLDVRKGLPFSLELGVNLVWLVDSQLVAPGLELRWAIQEGYHMLPDFGLRGSVNHLVGNPDMDLTVVGIDAVISKGFGLFGMINLAPYLSWSVLLVDASSHVINPTPQIDNDVNSQLVFPSLSAGDNVHHKLTLGVRMLASILNLTIQAEFEMLRKDPTSDSTKFFGSVATLTTKLGLDF